MQPEPKSEETILEEALSFTEKPARSAYLDDACAGDDALRQRIEALLQAHEEAGQFLQTAAERPPIDLLAREPATLVAVTEQPGERIGRYKLLQKIGEGGCGVVYMAEQSEPVRRRVALKVIKLGMDTKSVIARFEAERQALALMDHPNIAKVLDAGATDAGRPYFVMELVRGTKITEYCDQQNLPTRGRLDLFIKVCQAVQHAHQKGIIHRDIKPSNILVTLHDGVPVPKVIDFGIAKATTGQRLTDKTLFTALEQFIGTPAYMSPEQAEMSGLDIDTRCDIYSLGVLLYELLTGQTPFDAKELMASGIDAMRKTIREKEPVRPSTKLSQTLVAANVNSLKSPATGKPATEEEVRADSCRLLRIKETITLLRGDVDWIVMKCLEKDRARRYETANGLASDIQRHLNNEAVLARPPSAAYRFQKLARRNKLAFAAASAVTLTLIAGFGFSTWAFLSEAAQRRTAVASAEKARQAELKAETAAATTTHNLYFAEMNLAGSAAAEPGGIGRIASLTAKWRPEKGAADLRGWEWYYLRSLLHQDLFTLSGHTNGVNSVAWNSDGKRLATGGSDHTLRIWDAANRQVTLTLTGHTNSVNSVAWSRDGKLLASASDDNTVRVWDGATGHQTLILPGQSKGMVAVSWSQDGKRLASGSEDNTITVWDAVSGTIIRTMSGNGRGVHLVSWSPDGKRLASGHYKMVKVWDVDSGTNILTLLGHSFRVSSVSWSPDGKRLASGSWDDTVKVWDAQSGTSIRTLRGHRGTVYFVSWSPDGNRLASGSADNTVVVWDPSSGELLHTLRGHTSEVNSVSWSPDGSRLASASSDNAVKVWDVNSDEMPTLRGHTDVVSSLAWSPDGTRLASGSVDKTVKLWDMAGRHEPMTLHGHTDNVWDLAWSPDGRRLASASMDSTIKLWDGTSGQLVTNLSGHKGGIATVAWSPDGRHLASGGAEDYAVMIWDASSGQVIHSPLRGHSGWIMLVAWSPDGKLLASASADKTVKVWDPESKQLIHTLRGHSNSATGLAWSPDGKHLASGSFDNTIKIWDVASEISLITLRGHTGGIVSVSGSRDGKTLASGSWDHTVKIWDPAGGQERLTLRGHLGKVLYVAWSADGTRLASASADKTIRIWDARKGYALERE